MKKNSHANAILADHPNTLRLYVYASDSFKIPRVKEFYRNERVNDRDGVKIDFADGWVHLRKSNTEPIIRVYSEAATMEKANQLAESVMALVIDR